MLNVSKKFKDLLYEGKRNYKLYADITLLDGTELNITNKEIWQGGFVIEDAVSSADKFDIGAAIINRASITLNNIYDDFSKFDFDGAEAYLYVGLALDEEERQVEKIPKGVFTVDETKYNGSLITLECLDNIRKFDRPYSESKLVYPATIGEIIRDACLKCNVKLATSSFDNASFQIPERPNDEAITFREVLSWAAQISGQFARCNVLGELEIKWYEQAILDRVSLNGGYFDKDNPNIYVSGDNVYGGIFNPWDTGDVYNAGTFKETSQYHHIYEYKSSNISTDDVIITGVRITEKSKGEDKKNELITYNFGEDGYVISIENNELITNGIGKEIVKYLGERLVGFRFRKASISHLSNPTIEAGDIAYFSDRKNNVYPIIVSVTKFTTGNFQETTSAAESPQKNSETRYSVSTKTYVENRKNIEKEITEYDKAVQSLTSLITQSFGIFKTEEIQEDGSIIYYMHNKPTISESKTIWKMTAGAFAVSTDGGKTWSAGIDSSGNAVVNVLSAIGINFNWARGGTLTLGGSNNANGRLRILDSGGQQVVGCDNSGINAIAGHIGGFMINDHKIYGGDSSSGTVVMQTPAANTTWAFGAGGKSHDSYADCPFRVAKTGEMYSTKGQIGGYTIDSQRLYNGGVGMSSYGGHYAFWAGETNGQHGGPSSDAKFKVGSNGSVVSTGSGSFSSVTISGSTITSSSLSGSAGSISGGTYRSGTLSSCSLGGTSLTTGSGSSCFRNGSDGMTEAYGDSFAGLTAGSTKVVLQATHYLSVDANTRILRDLNVNGTKNRVIKTRNFGERCLSAYETPMPTFADFGTGKLDDSGECSIVIDPVFAETVDKTCVPTVFLTKYGEGDIWVDKGKSTHDIVVIRGTPNLEFAWETRYKQINCCQERMPTIGFDQTDCSEQDFLLESEVELEHNTIDYEDEASQYLMLYDIQSVNYADEGANYYENFERGLIA